MGFEHGAAGSVAYYAVTLAVGAVEILGVPFALMVGMLGSQIGLGVKDDLCTSLLT